MGKLSWRVSLKISLGFCWVGVVSQNCTFELCRKGVLSMFLLPRSTLYKFFMFPISKNQKNVTVFIECTPLLQLDEGNRVLGQAGKSSHFMTKLNF